MNQAQLANLTNDEILRLAYESGDLLAIELAKRLEWADADSDG